MAVTLTNQSFRDSGGSEMFPDLRMGGVIIGPSVTRYTKGNSQDSHEECDRELVERAYKSLERYAEEKGHTHVFRVIECFEQEDSNCCYAIGTGYRPKESSGRSWERR